MVEDAITELSATHKEIYITAHSMGTLFAITQAIQNPTIKTLFLLAVPLKLFLKPRVFSNAIKVYLGKVSPTDAVAMASKNCYGIAPDKNLLHYLGWIPRYLELFRKNKSTITKKRILLYYRMPLQTFFLNKRYSPEGENLAQTMDQSVTAAFHRSLSCRLP